MSGDDHLIEAEGCIYWFSWAILMAAAVVIVLGCTFGVILMNWGR